MNGDGITWMDILISEEIEKLNKENERLNNIIDELKKCYIDVIKKCDWMIEHKDWMNDIAIKQCADEIKDVCKYYIRKLKELKGE